MDTKKIRKLFFDFFKAKKHEIVDSAPITIKNDPSLMFTNAGMNQFKNIFLGDEIPKCKRIANTQKCLRVSGKHNDLEEVGIDKYHHTMFEMLGNWSFGDYFKENAIQWAWDLLINVYKLDEKRLYVSIFGGDKKDNLEKDIESYNVWNKIVDDVKIIDGSKKDNFWEMGETGPCGPCSEIHIDLRSENEIKKIPTRNLINKDHSEVIEIWNLVFIEFNRLSNGKLVLLPNKHVDTGMGLERLAMAIKGLKSTYDIDLFDSIIKSLSKESNYKYGENSKIDIAFRVIVDHIRAIVFTISDGEIPSNNKSGYVIRRILRRAVRYGFSTLNIKKPFLHKLAKTVISEYGDVFDNLINQQDFIVKVILEEEKTFLKTLDKGLSMILNIKNEAINENKTISGKVAFDLYDTYGFPYDLTDLIAKENNLSVDEDEFKIQLELQRNRSRNVSKIIKEDWTIISQEGNCEFAGYEKLSSKSKILKYRKTIDKELTSYHVVFNITPFYSESGGQVGDTGHLIYDGKKIEILNTIKENDLIIHQMNELPLNLNDFYKLEVNAFRRSLISNNHSATHLLHAALQKILGNHVIQKGSLVNDKALRFDFSHFTKISDTEIQDIQNLVNEKIRKNIEVKILENMPIEKAKKMDAMALFGEKYGRNVRVVIIDNQYSIELCGGTHVSCTSEIGTFKVISESSISSGIRRIEALTSVEAENYTTNESNEIKELKSILKTGDVLSAVSSLLLKNKKLDEEILGLSKIKKNNLKDDLKKNILIKNDINILINEFDDESLDMIKKIGFELKNEFKNLIFLATTKHNSKPSILLLISEDLVNKFNLDSRIIINDLSVYIEGGGGGQQFFSTAGGKNIDGLSKVISIGKKMILQKVSV
ncbi:MAG: alanine--tRNA ligase [Marinoscillum sp.]